MDARALGRAPTEMGAPRVLRYGDGLAEGKVVAADGWRRPIEAHAPPLEWRRGNPAWSRPAFAMCGRWVFYFAVFVAGAVL